MSPGRWQDAVSGYYASRGRDEVVTTTITSTAAHDDEGISVYQVPWWKALIIKAVFRREVKALYRDAYRVRLLIARYNAIRRDNERLRDILDSSIKVAP